MEDYGFDEDDLINDYIADNNDDYPEEEPDDYFDEEPQEPKPSPPNTSHDAIDTNPIDDTMEVESGEKLDVPTTITANLNDNASTSYTASSRNNDLFNFERYSGISGWRTAKSTSLNHGATTMEATEWKKQEVRGDVDSDSDDLDVKTRSKRPAVDVVSRGAEAQLVGMHQKSEEEILGRSWGSSNRLIRDKRFVFDESGSALPRVGEDSIILTVADGTTVNVKRSKCDASVEEETDKDECLLGMPMGEIVRRADILQKRAIKRKLEREERRAKRSKVHKLTEDDDVEEIPETVDEAINEEVTEDSETKELERNIPKEKQHRREMQLKQRLWVDKHAPTSISHLLSDERTNREVIRALKLWDPYVFKRDAPVRPKPAYGYRQGEKKDAKKEEENESGKELKLDVRPDENSRVIMLSGPPGVGKTTLAHIVCR